MDEELKPPKAISKTIINVTGDKKGMKRKTISVEDMYLNI